MAVAVLAGGLPAMATPAGAAEGVMMARNCLTCHAAGATASPIPRLTGLSAERIADLLRAFKQDRRPATIMNRIAKGYSDEQIEALAEHLAGAGHGLGQ